MGWWGEYPWDSDTYGDWMFEFADVVTPRLNKIWRELWRAEEGDEWPGSRTDIYAWCGLVVRFHQAGISITPEIKDRALSGLYRLAGDEDWIKGWKSPGRLRAVLLEMIEEVNEIHAWKDTRKRRRSG